MALCRWRILSNDWKRHVTLAWLICSQLMMQPWHELIGWTGWILCQCSDKAFSNLFKYSKEKRVSQKEWLEKRKTRRSKHANMCYWIHIFGNRETTLGYLSRQHSWSLLHLDESKLCGYANWICCISVGQKVIHSFFPSDPLQHPLQRWPNLRYSICRIHSTEPSPTQIHPQLLSIKPIHHPLSWKFPASILESCSFKIKECPTLIEYRTCNTGRSAWSLRQVQFSS